MTSEHNASAIREEKISGNLEAYLPYIVECIKPADLLRIPCFSRELVKRGLNFLMHEIDDSNRFSSLCEMMSGQEEYSNILRLLENETAIKDERYRKLLSFLGEGLHQKIDPTTLLPHLLSKGTITDKCTEEVRRQAVQKGTLMAWWELLLCLTARNNDWVSDLITSLISVGKDDIAAMIWPDMIPIDNLNQSHEKARGQMKHMETQDADAILVSDRQDMKTQYVDVSLVSDPQDMKTQDVDASLVSAQQDVDASLVSDPQDITTLNESDIEEMLLYNRNPMENPESDERTEAKTIIGADEDTDTNIETDIDAVDTGKKDNLIVLRDYQMELAKEGCEGKNVVIMAPTNSGKTIVASRIIQVHLQKRKRLNQLATVVFLVENEALALQQGKVFAEQLPSYRTKVFTGSVQRDKGQYFWDYLSRRDILVLTAQLLVNALNTKHIASVREFSLIVFDECHHTNNDHMYNVIMRNYIDMKMQVNIGNTDLPQIVGLTASLGVGGSTDYATGLKHMKTILANMDAKVLCTVRTPENQESLQKQMDCPIEVHVPVKPREKDRFRDAVMDVVTKIDEYIEKSMKADCTINKDQMQKYKIPKIIFGTEQYCNWSSDFNKYIAENLNDILSRKLNPCRVHLEIYNNALLIHKDARITDALRIVDNFVYDFSSISRLDETDVILVNIYEEIFNVKRKSYQFAEQPENPKLIKMEEILIEFLITDENARGIIFVKTRDLALALKEWVNESEHLKCLNAETLLGQSDGGMTKCKQNDALEYFKGGLHRVIIATSVAEEGLDIRKCNLVIRYEHVTNEIVRLQSRGRARAANSRYFIIAEFGSWILEKEDKNRRCEEIMNTIVRDIREYIYEKPEEWEKEICTIQRQIKENTARKQEQLQKSVIDDVDVQCANCSEVICKSKDVKRIKGVHYIIVNPDADEKVEYKESSRRPFCEPEGIEYRDVVFCGNVTCKRSLGQVCKYKNMQLPLIKIDALKFLFANKEVKTFKKWKDVPFVIAEFTVDDLNRVVAERDFYLQTMNQQ